MSRVGDDTRARVRRRARASEPPPLGQRERECVRERETERERERGREGGREGESDRKRGARSRRSVDLDAMSNLGFQV